MIHLITDNEFLLTLKRISDKLCPEGSLIIRTTVASTKSFSWKRLIEKKRIKIHKGMLRFRSEQDIVSLIEKAGFKVITRELSAPGDEEIWFIASPGIAK